MKRHHATVWGLIWATAGTAFTFFMLYSLNHVLDDLSMDKGKTVSSIKILRPPAPKHVAVPKAKPQSKSSEQKSSVDPMPQLYQGLSGIEFGADELGWLDKNQMSEEMARGLKNMAMTADTVDEKPQVKAAKEMDYPSWARKKGIEGHVVINMLINTLGKIEATQILESQPSGVFDTAALKFVRTWNFRPARYKGEDVKVWTTQTIRFDLGD